MTWLKTDDKFPEHRKVRRLPDGAYRLHHTALCACAKDETDGFVTELDIADMEHGARLRKHVDALVSAGLWEVVRGGWTIHDFLVYNPSHAQLEVKRAVDKSRQEKYRKGRKYELPSEDDMSQRDNGVTTALSQPPVPDPTRPVPVLVVAEPVSDRHLGDKASRDALKLVQ